MHNIAEGGGEPSNSDIQVVSRVAQILRLLAPSRQTLRTSDIVEQLDLQRPTAHRYLASLASVGLLERCEAGVYRVGPLMVELGAIALRSLRVLDVCAATMQALADEAHETVVLSVWGGMGPVVIQVHEDPQRLVQLSVRVGSRLPLVAAQSQVFFAHLEDRVALQDLIGHLDSEERRRLHHNGEAIRRRGFAVDSRVFEGIRTLAVPVFDRRGAICATLAVVGTISRIPQHDGSLLLKMLSGAATEIACKLSNSSGPGR